LGSPTGPGTPGTVQTATIHCQPSVGRGGVLSDGLHSAPNETIYNVTLPWTFDLVDPTDAQPTGWGWTITIKPEAGPALVAPLTAAAIAALPQVDGIRTARLEDYVGLSDVLATGGTVTAGLAGVAADQAAASATAAAASATSASTSATSAATSATAAQTARTGAETAQTAAAGSATAAQASAATAAGSATTAAGSATAADQSEAAALAAQQAAETARDQTNALNLTATATTLTPGSLATAAVSGTLPDLSLAIGVPAGAKGDRGDPGPQGVGPVTVSATAPAAPTAGQAWMVL